jgi:hypothetical protein
LNLVILPGRNTSTGERAADGPQCGTSAAAGHLTEARDQGHWALRMWMLTLSTRCSGPDEELADTERGINMSTLIKGFDYDTYVYTCGGRIKAEICADVCDALPAQAG